MPYGRNPDDWSRSVVEPLFRYLHGLAVLYVLTPEAQTRFNGALEYQPVFEVVSAPTCPGSTRPGSPTRNATP